MPDLSNSRTITQIAIAQGGAGTTDLIAAPGTGLKIYVTGFVLVLTALGTAKFTEGTGPTDLTGAMEFVDSGGMVVIGPGQDTPVLQTNTANSKLSIVSTGGGATGWLRYFVAA